MGFKCLLHVQREMNADKLIQYPTFKDDDYEQRGCGGKLGGSAEFGKANAYRPYIIHLSCYHYGCKMSLTSKCCRFFVQTHFLKHHIHRMLLPIKEKRKLSDVDRRE